MYIVTFYWSPENNCLDPIFELATPLSDFVRQRLHWLEMPDRLNSNFFRSFTCMPPWMSWITDAYWYRLPLGTEQVVSSIHGSVGYISHVHWAYDYLGPLIGVLWVHIAWHKNCVKTEQNLLLSFSRNFARPQRLTTICDHLWRWRLNGRLRSLGWRPRGFLFELNRFVNPLVGIRPWKDNFQIFSRTFPKEIYKRRFQDLTLLHQILHYHPPFHHD